MIKISIIVPIYNVEKYLRKCLESIENQTYKNIELILVNDGSTDKSEEIIDEYIKKYDNIKYIKKENGGLSDSRNCGVKEATGNYICFVDSDDYLDENLFLSLKQYLNQEYDMIKYKLIRVDEEYKEIEKIDGPIFENKTGQEAFNILYGQDVMLQPAWLYLYKKSFWDSNNFSYPVGKLHEDFARTALIMLKAKKVLSVDIYGYNYVQSNSSITRGNDEDKKMKRALDMIEHYDYMMNQIEQYDLYNRTKENIKIYYTNCIILKLEELSKKNKKVYMNEIKKRGMLRNIKARNLKQFLKKIILNINVNWYLKLR